MALGKRTPKQDELFIPTAKLATGQVTHSTRNSMRFWLSWVLMTSWRPPGARGTIVSNALRRRHKQHFQTGVAAACPRRRPHRQLYAAANFDGMRLAVGFPDLHPGKGSPVGAAFVTEGLIYP
jgi:hypothetical protein